MLSILVMILLSGLKPLFEKKNNKISSQKVVLFIRMKTLTCWEYLSTNELRDGNRRFGQLQEPMKRKRDFFSHKMDTWPGWSISSGKSHIPQLGLNRGWNNVLGKIELLPQECLPFIRQVPIVVSPRELLLDVASGSQRLQRIFIKLIKNDLINGFFNPFLSEIKSQIRQNSCPKYYKSQTRQLFWGFTPIEWKNSKSKCD